MLCATSRAFQRCRITLCERVSPGLNRVSTSRLCARPCFTAEFLVGFALPHYHVPRASALGKSVCRLNERSGRLARTTPPLSSKPYGRMRSASPHAITMSIQHACACHSVACLHNLREPSPSCTLGTYFEVSLLRASTQRTRWRFAHRRQNPGVGESPDFLRPWLCGRAAFYTVKLSVIRGTRPAGP